MQGGSHYHSHKKSTLPLAFRPRTLDSELSFPQPPHRTHFSFARHSGEGKKHRRRETILPSGYDITITPPRLPKLPPLHLKPCNDKRYPLQILRTLESPEDLD